MIKRGGRERGGREIIGRQRMRLGEETFAKWHVKQAWNCIYFCCRLTFRPTLSSRSMIKSHSKHDHSVLLVEDICVTIIWCGLLFKTAESGLNEIAIDCSFWQIEYSLTVESVVILVDINRGQIFWWVIMRSVILFIIYWGRLFWRNQLKRLIEVSYFGGN